MSALDDLVTSLSVVNRDARELCAELSRLSTQLARAATQTAALVAGTRNPAGVGAASALDAASRATLRASLVLERAVHQGEEFAARHAGGVGPSTASPSPGRNEPLDGPGAAPSDPVGDQLRALGMVEVAASAADYSDNPIVGPFARSADMSRDDYVWAVQAWDAVVRPGLASGMGRDAFAGLDAAQGAPPLRRLADVYDIFLGSNPIVLSRRPDGTLEVADGRHRVEVALELGVRDLPVVIREASP